MVAYRATERILHVFYTSASDGGKWLASCPGRFTPRKRAPSIRFVFRKLGLVISYPAFTEWICDACSVKLSKALVTVKHTILHTDVNQGG